jgi:hypothetical protein
MQLRKIQLGRFSGAACGLLWFAAAAAQAPTSATPSPASTTAPTTSTATCKEAVVSPVSGFAECVNPRGAPVAPPPKRPDAARAPANR